MATIIDTPSCHSGVIKNVFRDTAGCHRDVTRGMNKLKSLISSGLLPPVNGTPPLREGVHSTGVNRCEVKN